MKDNMKALSCKQSSVLFVLTCLGLYLITFWIICPIIFKQWRYSWYHTRNIYDNVDLTKRSLDANDLREAYATKYLNQSKSKLALNKPTTEDISKPHKEVVIGIITNHRKLELSNGDVYQPNYLIQTVAAILNFQPRSQLRSKIVICDCNRDRQIPPIIGNAIGYNQGIIVRRFVTLENSSANLDIYKKEQNDYIFCLTEAYKYRSRKDSFIVILEDDVVATPSFFSDLATIVFTELPLKQMKGLSTKSWSLIKLYYPDKWRGFGWDYQSCLEITGIFLLTSVVAYIFPFTHKLRPMDNSVFKFIIVLLFAVYCTVLVLSIGRQNTFLGLQLKLLHPAPGCCTQAILYNSEIIPLLLKFLQNIKCTMDYSIDLAIDDFSKSYKYMTFFTEPNLVKHVGLISSIRAWAKDIEDFL